MLSIPKNKSPKWNLFYKVDTQYCQVEIDPSQEFKSNVIDWADQYLSIDDATYKFITRFDPKPGNAYGLIKCHKEGKPLRIIVPGCNTAVDNSSIGLGIKSNL